MVSLQPNKQPKHTHTHTRAERSCATDIYFLVRMHDCCRDESVRAARQN